VKVALIAARVRYKHVYKVTIMLEQLKDKNDTKQKFEALVMKMNKKAIKAS